MSKQRYAQYTKLFIMLFAAIIGCIVTNIWIAKSYDFSNFDLTFYVNSIHEEYNAKKMLVQIFVKRVKQLVVVVLCMKVFRIDRVLDVLLALYGLSLGLLITIQSYYLGLFGVFVVAFTVVPQFVFYYLMLVCVRAYVRAGEMTEQKIKSILFFIAFFALGIIYETIFLEKFFNYFYQYMVTV